MRLNTEFSCAAGVLAGCLEGYEKLTFRMKEQLLHNLFQKYLLDFSSDIDFAAKFESDFLQTCVKGAKNLHDKGKDNLIYHFARCFLLRDQDDICSQTRLSINKMPYGLLDYTVKFFSLGKTNNLTCEKDYEDWQISMYAKFGVQWNCMHRGPT